MAMVNKMKNLSGEETTALNLTKEEVRILHQSLNEVCHALTFTDSEFQTRMGTERGKAVALMYVLEQVYHSYQ